MVISDKQSLRRCVKQAVRHAPIAEACLRMPQGESFGFGRLSASDKRAMEPFSGGALFGGDALAVASALEAMGLSGMNEEEVLEAEASYSPAGWLRQLLDEAKAQRVLVPVPVTEAGDARFEDDRLSPLPEVTGADFAPGRYGVDYRARADAMRESIRLSGARHLLATDVDRDALMYCLLPLCEEERLALHLRVRDVQEAEQALSALSGFGYVHMLFIAETEERPIIDLVAAQERATLALTRPDEVPYALARLGARFQAYVSGADYPELMLGRWRLFREKLWPALAEAYLPLARSGVVLTTDAIEADVVRLMGGNLLAWEV